MQQKEQDDDGRNDDLFPQCRGERADRLVNEAGTVVDCFDLDATQCGRNLLNPRFDPVDHRARVFTVPHHDHAADRLAAVVVKGAASEVRAELHAGHVLNAKGHAFALFDDSFLDVADRLRRGHRQCPEILCRER